MKPPETNQTSQKIVEDVQENPLKICAIVGFLFYSSPIPSVQISTSSLRQNSQSVLVSIKPQDLIAKTGGIRRRKFASQTLLQRKLG